jgi:hypothetical protein
MVGIAKYFMRFTQNESCGKCVLCREGTKQMLNLLEDITEGRATLETLDTLQELAVVVQRGSLCGLGKTAPNPVLLDAQAFQGRIPRPRGRKEVPTGQCKTLASPEIEPGALQGLYRLREEVPGGRHQRRGQENLTSSIPNSASNAASVPPSANSTRSWGIGHGERQDHQCRRRDIPIEGEKNLLEVIRKAGIDIPTFCYVSELSRVRRLPHVHRGHRRARPADQL